MGRQPVPISAADIAEYAQCSACNVVFNTEGVSKSKMIQVYKNHCLTQKHLIAISTMSQDEPSNARDVSEVESIVKKQQEQIDVLMRAVKELSKENQEMKERFIRAEHRYKQLQTDLFGVANKYGKDNEGLVAYKSINERITALENRPVAPTTPTVPTAPVPSVPTVPSAPVEEKKEEHKYVNDDNIEDFNPYKLKKKYEIPDKYEFDDDMIEKIGCLSVIINNKDDEDEGIDAIEDFIYEFDCDFGSWLNKIRANSNEVLCLDKINQIQIDINNIVSVLEKIRDDFQNPKYNAENKGIQNLQKKMLEYAYKIWTMKDLI